MFGGNKRFNSNNYINQNFLLPSMPATTPTATSVQEQEEPISLVIRELKSSSGPARTLPVKGSIKTVKPLPFHSSYRHILPAIAQSLPQPPPDTLHSEENFANEFSKLSPPSPPSPITTSWNCAIRNLMDKHQTPDSSSVSRKCRSDMLSSPESPVSSQSSPSTTTRHPTQQLHHRNKHPRQKAVLLEEKNIAEYQEKRIRNNIAAKKSRDKRRLVEKMMQLLNAYLKNKLDLLEGITDKCFYCKSKREFEYSKLAEPDYKEIFRKIPVCVKDTCNSV